MSRSSTVRLKFLNGSAHLLANSSPTTAAFLQSRIDQLAEGSISLDSSLPGESTILALPELRYLEICASCGFNLKPTDLSLKPSKATKPTTKVKKCAIIRDSVRRLHVTCGRCGADAHVEITKTDLNKDRRRARVRHEQKDSGLSTSSPPERHTDTPGDIPKPNADQLKQVSISTTAKKRSKARKANSLSAMLAKSKADARSNNSSLGFDLMDMMKSI